MAWLRGFTPAARDGIAIATDPQGPSIGPTENAMDRQYHHPDNDAIALLARALTPIFAAALAQSANPALPVNASAGDRGTRVELPRAA